MRRSSFGIERFQVPLSMHYATPLAHALGCFPSDLESESAPDVRQEIIEVLNDLSDEHASLVLALARALRA